MIQLKIATLPDPSDPKRIVWQESLLVWEPGRSLAGYLQRAGITPSDLDKVVWRGRAFQRAEGEESGVADLSFAGDLAIWEPGEFDEIHVIPRALGGNTQRILGVVGAVISLWMGFPNVAAAALTAGKAAWAGLQAAMIGYSIGSGIGSLLVGRPRDRHGEEKTSHAWSGITNSYRAGGVVPVVLGRAKQGGVVVSQFVRRTRPLADGNVTKERLHLLVLVSKGQIENLADVKLNEQPFANFVDDTNELTYAYTKGETPEQWYDEDGNPTSRPSGFNATATTFPQNHPLADDSGPNLVPGTPFSYTSIRTDLDAFEVLLTIPALGKPDDKGNWLANTVRYSYRFRKVGDPWPDWIQLVTTKSTRAPYFETIRRANLTPGQYEIEVRWDSADQTEVGEDYAQVIVTGLTEEKQETRRYHGKAMLAIKGIATGSLTTVPLVTSVPDGLVVPQWDGSDFTAPAWTRNPAWLILEAFRNRTQTVDLTAEGFGIVQIPAWGVGDYITDEELDLDSFKAWAEYCDEQIPSEIIEATVAAGSTATTVELTAPVTLEAGKTYGIRVTHLAEPSDSENRFEIRTVTNGAGSHSAITVSEAFHLIPAEDDDAGLGEMEARHELDIVLDQPQRAMDALLELAANARGTLVISGGKIRAVVDRPGTPVQTFTMGNIVRGSFSLSYNGEAERVNGFDVTILDRARDYDSTPITVRDAVAVAAGKPPKIQPLAQFGVTRASEAIRNGRWRLNANRYLRRIISFEADADAVLIQAGDLFNFAHDVPQWGFSGRVLGSIGDPATVMLDRSVQIEDGKTYEVRVRFADDTDEVRTVTSPADDSPYYGLTVDPPFSQPPADGDIYAFGEVGISTKPYRCISISRSDYSRRRILAIEYNRSVVDDSGVIEVIDYTQLPNFGAPPPPITDLYVFEEAGERNDLSVVSTAILQWTEPRPQVGYGFYKGGKLERSLDGTNWEDLTSADGNEHRWPNPPQDIPMWFRVIPYSTAGKYNYDGIAIFGPITFDGLTDLPADVVAETPLSEKGRFVYRWREVTRAHQYEVRSADANWGNDDPATGFLARGRGQDYTLQQPASRSVTLYVKAVDAFGNYSQSATAMTCTDSAPTAPVLTSATRTKRGIRVKVAAHAHVDVTGMFLHASTVAGFTPNETNRVAQVVSRDGGDFIFETENSATFYFRVTAADYLTERLGDWVYSNETNEKKLVVTPVNPTVSDPKIGQPRGRPTDRPGAARYAAAGSTASVLQLDQAVIVDGLSTGTEYAITFQPANGGALQHRNVTAVAPSEAAATELTLDSALNPAPVVGDIVTLRLLRESLTRRRLIHTVRVGWGHVDHSDNPAGSLIGFQVVLYDASAFNPADPVYLEDSGLLADPLLRTHVFVVPGYDADDEIRTVRAAVRAIYVDGLASALVSSSGTVLLDPIDRTETPAPDPGHPLSPGYTEDFLGASLPTGMAVSGASASVSGGILTLTKTNAFVGSLTWDIAAWAAAKHMAQRSATGTVQVRVRVTPRGNWDGLNLAIFNQDGYGRVFNGSGPDNGAWHVLTNLPFSAVLFGGQTFEFRYAALPIGTVIEIDAIALMFDGSTLEQNAHVQLGVEARDQFDTPDGGTTLNLVVPVRVPGPNGEELIVEKNGVFFVADNGGTLRTLSNYRQGATGSAQNVGAGSSINPGNQSTFSPPLYPCRGTNKVRIGAEKLGAALQQVAALAYPVREVLEAQIVNSGFIDLIVLMHWIFEGGTTGTNAVDPGAGVTVETKRTVTGLGANAAYYYVSNDGVFVASDYVFRATADLRFDMPLVQKPDGTFYMATFLLNLRRGVGSLSNGSFMTLSSEPGGSAGNVKIFLPCDGRSHQVPIHRPTFDDLLPNGVTRDWSNTGQDLIVELNSASFESGAGSPTYAITVEKWRWFYVRNPSGARLPTGQNLKLIYFEEF